MKQRTETRPSITAIGILAVLLGSTASGVCQRATPVPKLDGDQFLGEWYQIARLPGKAEKKCVGNAFTLYARGEKTRHFQQVQSCTVAGGSNQIRNDTGVQNDDGSGKLGLTFLYFLHHPRWVVGIAPDDTWALVGTPNHKQLWLLARASTLPANVEADAKSKAAAQGYNIGKMIEVTQNDVELRKRVTQVVSSTTGK